MWLNLKMQHTYGTRGYEERENEEDEAQVELEAK